MPTSTTQPFDKPIDDMSEAELDQHIQEVQQQLENEMQIRQRLSDQLKQLQQQRNLSKEGEDKNKIKQLLQRIQKDL